jgi:hypothetical protein
VLTSNGYRAVGAVTSGERDVRYVPETMTIFWHYEILGRRTSIPPLGLGL